MRAIIPVLVLTIFLVCPKLNPMLALSIDKSKVYNYVIDSPE